MTTSTEVTRTWQGLTIPNPGTYVLDPSHTTVGFVAKHMMVSKVRGHFTEVDATLEVGDDPTTSTVTVNVGLASVTTGSDDRDNHLRSSDFFNAESASTMTFRSTSIEHVDGGDFRLTGDLTISGVTRPLTLDTSFEGVGVTPWGTQVIGFSSKAEIDREEWGLTWNAPLEAGGVLVGKKVTLQIDAEFNPAA